MLVTLGQVARSEYFFSLVWRLMGSPRFPLLLSLFIPVYFLCSIESNFQSGIVPLSPVAVLKSMRGIFHNRTIIKIVLLEKELDS